MVLVVVCSSTGGNGGAAAAAPATVLVALVGIGGSSSSAPRTQRRGRSSGNSLRRVDERVASYNNVTSFVVAALQMSLNCSRCVDNEEGNKTAGKSSPK